MKILNLYAGIGGNRKLWGDEHEIIAIELDPKIAKIYQDFFPKDKVIVTDAHKYLLEHYKEFDFIWSSPPCPTHSRINTSFKNNKQKIKYVDMNLYEEIILLQKFFEGKFCVENVISYYKPLIIPQLIGRNYFWANFLIPNIKLKKGTIGSMNGKYKKFSKQRNWYAKKPKEKRNCVEPKLGLHIFECAFKEKQEVLFKEKNEEVGV